MSYSRNSRKNLLMESLQDYFKNPENIIKIIPIISSSRTLSLRVIDWFVTNYSKKFNTSYIINNTTNTIITEGNYDPYYCSEFVVYLNYRLQLKAYSKDNFDPFCRVDSEKLHERIDFYYNKDNIIDYIKKNNLDLPNIMTYLNEQENNFFTTTSGQLNFFRWIIKNNIIDYIMKNLKKIETDMNKSYKEHYSNSVKKKKRRKKRHELSVSASKSLSKSNVKVVLTFN